MTKINFFGTHNFARAMLQTLFDSGIFEIVSVFTSPDRPVGREQKINESAVKILAGQNKLKIIQPETLKNFDFSPHADVDLNIICEYGLIIPKDIVETPKYGSINVHPSLLPKYRGASPIQAALINGDTQTGVTIMLIDEKMDHGPILNQEKVNIGPNDTYPVLSEKLIPVAARLLLKTTDDWMHKKITPQIQDENAVTFCKLFTKQDGYVDFTKMTASQIYNLYRGLIIWPGIWTTFSNKRFKLLEIKLGEKNTSVGTAMTENNQIFIGCLDQKTIEIIKIQPEGKKEMNAKEFLNGYKNLLCSSVSNS